MAEHTFDFTKMYDLMFSGRFKHCQDKKGSQNPQLSTDDADDYLNKHELAAVHSVFGEEVFEKVTVGMDLKGFRRFLKQIENNTNPLGFVTKVNDEGKAVFEHFTYGEYLAAQFLANNLDKTRLIREELFSDGRKNLMMILSVMLAEENPLHLAVINRNVDEIEKYIEDKNVYDKAGRNPLHLATYVEPRCVDWKSCLIQVSIEDREYLKNIVILKKMMKFNYADKDTLFQWNALEYAFKNKSFLCVEMILRKFVLSEKDLHDYSKKYINNDNLVPFCLTHSCRKLLSSILEKWENYFKKHALIVIEHTIKNCYFEENKTLDFVIETLIERCHFDLGSRNKQGKTALHLAVKYGKAYAVQMLLEKGAVVNVLTNYHKTPLHYAAQSGNFKIVTLLIKKAASVNALADDYLTPLHYAAQSGNFEIVESRKGHLLMPLQRVI
jgi:hypothetical protein